MSGAEDLARLTQTIDKTDELLLSPEIKMVEVSPGVFRPTNAMVMANLSTLLGGAMPYTSVALGLEGTTDGTNFSVLSTVHDEYVNIYRNTAGAAVHVDAYPNAEALKAQQELVRPSDPGAPEAFNFEDGFRYSLMRLLSDSTLEFPSFKLQAGSNGLEIADAFGFVASRLGFKESVINGLQVVAGPESGILVTDIHGFVIARADNNGAYWGRQSANAAVATHVPLLDQQQRTDIKQLIGYGQSLSVGHSAIPPISTSQPYQNVMLASGVRIRPGDIGYNASAFIPLVEEVGTISTNQGETPISGMCNGITRRAIEDGENGADPARWVMAGMAPGRSGWSVERLSPPPLGTEGAYERVIEAVKDCNSLARSLGKTYSVWGYSWEQGESNYQDGWERTSYQYGQYQLALFDRMSTDILAVTGQKFRPYLFTYQVAAHRRYDRDSMYIALAQWRASRKRDDVVLAAPCYIFKCSSDNLHLTNESSWLLGEYMGRAAYETMVRRSGKWRPLEPVSVNWTSTYIDVKFHVPAGQLVLDDALAALTHNMGFDIRSDGAVDASLISSVAIQGQDTVRVSLAKPAAAGAVLTYGRGRPGDPAHSGPITGARGNLRDTHGLYDEVTSPSGAVYKMHNACVMFEYSRKNGF